MPPPDLIPKTTAHLTAHWLSAVLRVSGHDVDVSAVEVTPIGTGQMASSMRMTPTYAHNRSEAPNSLVVKLASDDPNSRSAGARGAYLKEVRFYEQLGESLPVATPSSFWSAIDEQTNDFAIVLEDMHPATQGDQITGCSVDQVRAAACNIAGLHAPTWNDPALFDFDWLTLPKAERGDSHREARDILEMVTPGFVARYHGRISSREIELLYWFAETAEQWFANDNGRLALTHCDHRLDNLLFNAADGERPVTVVDWQTIAVRNPVADISYLLGTSVEPAVRREIEGDVVREYHDRLCELGVTGFSAEACFEDYRLQTPHTLLLTVLGSMLTVQTDRGDDMFMAMLHRSTEQMSDLDVR